MKKIICLCLVLAALFCCAACTQEEQEKPTPTYAYQSGDVKIAIDADAAPILAALGEWRDYSESASCAFTGLDKVYTYAMNGHTGKIYGELPISIPKLALLFGAVAGILTVLFTLFGRFFLI